eukprot:TRINITY_DN32309_c0_g1_i1.p1 TRINITY_DN32309_c0_g1~~TRINITY_DN32309_c0_g1_i1.p1  ORF type:complete len:466 (+),score=95.49 TRINITY_DN32309_c0_g1_i1:82-1398(+)
MGSLPERPMPEGWRCGLWAILGSSCLARPSSQAFLAAWGSRPEVRQLHRSANPSVAASSAVQKPLPQSLRRAHSQVAGTSVCAIGVGAAAAFRLRRRRMRCCSELRLRALPAGIAIVGTGSAAPESVVTNDNLGEIVDTNDEWITQRTGIKRRHVLKPDESLASLSALAAQRALESAQMAPEDVELVIHATSTPDDIFGTGPQVASLLGADQAVAFDLTAACSGFVFALTTAAQYVRSGAYKSAVVVGADCLSRWVDWSDRGTCVLFGDGAGAVVITATEPENDALIGFQMGSDGNGACHLGVKVDNEPVTLGGGNEGGSAKFSKLGMNGKEVFRFATSRVPKTLTSLLESHGVKGEEVDWLLLHQANRRIMDSAAKRLGLPQEKIICNLDEYGNTSAASIPLALDEAVRDGRVERGQLLAICGFGAGLTWGGMLLRF